MGARRPLAVYAQYGLLAVGLPYLDEVRIVVIKDGQAMMVQLESNSLDAADAPPLPGLRAPAKDSGLHTVDRAERHQRHRRQHDQAAHGQ